MGTEQVGLPPENLLFQPSINFKVQTGGRLRGDVPGQSGLPPREFWKFDLGKEKIPTPIDDRGLVDVQALIRAVKDTLWPGYEWPSHLSVHHLYWTEYTYTSRDDNGLGKRFRELPIHKGLMPRVFENLVHLVTTPSAPPDDEVMHYRLEGWEIAHNLFKSARQTVRWEKRARKRSELLERNPSILPEEFNGEDIIGKEIIQGMITRHFSGVERNLERLEDIPAELRIIDPNVPREEIAGHLGGLIVPKALRLVRAVAA